MRVEGIVKSMTEQTHRLVVLAGPTAVGKGTVEAKLFEDHPEIWLSVSATTRDPRPGEVDGKDYYFVSVDRFKEAINQGELIEYNQYVGNYYGTPLAPVKKMLSEGKDVLLEIDVNGAQKVRQQMPDGVFIFLTPPDLHELKHRLVHRGTDSETVIQNRMKQARNEIMMMSDYDYAVVNDTVANAVSHIKAIVEAEHVSVKRVIDSYRKMVEED